MRSGLPSARTIAYTRAQANGLMLSVISISRPTKPAFDTTTGMITATDDGSTIYSGKARFYSVRGVIQSVAGEMMSVTQTLCAIPWDIPDVPVVDDLVFVESSNDAHLVDRVFRIVDVPEGGIAPLTRELSLTGEERDVFRS